MDLKYLKSVALYVVSAILSLLFIAYIIYHMTASGKDTLTTANAVLTSTDESVSLDAYIMRDEKIIYSASDSLVYYLADNGDNVGKNDTLAYLYSGSNEDRSALMSVEKRLHLLEESDISDTVNTGAGNIDGKIQEVYSAILKTVSKGSLSYTEQNMDDMLIRINRRKILVKNLSGFHTQIELCKQQRESLLNRFQSEVEAVVAPQSGNFYSGADGYEGIFTQSKAETMTYEDFYTLTSSQADSSLLRNPYDGTAIGKLTTDSYWSICCEIDNEYIRYLSEGSSYPIEFSYNGGMTLNMTLDRVIVKYGTDKTVLVFGTRVSPDSFNYLRTQSVRLIFNRFTGYKVPSSAARFCDGEMGVYVLTNNKVEFKTVKVLYEVDGYYVVAPKSAEGELDLYDEIIVQGKGLYNGKYIG